MQKIPPCEVFFNWVVRDEKTQTQFYQVRENRDSWSNVVGAKIRNVLLFQLWISHLIVTCMCVFNLLSPLYEK